ncbi:MAG TPA: hypothetical protein VFE47_19645 [Tepidisphaeraceae bacterium]|jgi:DNA-binding transcriptional regulator LsrR (DeoR family)|nr:hypothetical protein [Tepidisphaeraceae bacterium]
MATIKLDYLTPRQRKAWQMRYHWGWRVQKIAIEMGIKHNSVCELLLRAEQKAGLPRRTVRVRMIRTQPRTVRGQQLSGVYNY